MRLPPSQPKLPRSLDADPRFTTAVRLTTLVLAELRVGFVVGLSVLALLVPSGLLPQANLIRSETGAPGWPVSAPRQAHLGDTPASDRVKRIAQWSAATQDHAAMPFVVIDKQAARLYVFDANARLQADTAVLIGSALGDHSVPGIGQKAVADVLPEERTTPAGRFNGKLGRNLTGEDVVWVDHEAAVSMHRVRHHQPSERRLQRLASETIEDNRISYGCVNVPIKFFDTYLLPVFSAVAAPIYVLPEHLTLEQVFGPMS